MNKNRTPFRVVLAILSSILLFATWLSQIPVEARQVVYVPQSMPVEKPLQQECMDGPDLRPGNHTFYPDPPVAGQPFNIDVEILNAGIVTGTENTWAGLYLDDFTEPPDFQVPVNTAGLDHTGVSVAHFTVPADLVKPGWLYLWFRVDVGDAVIESASCNGENNNLTPYIEILIPSDATATPTQTSTATATPFPKPQIYFFTANPTTVVLGQATTLHWQVYGEAVTVYLDGQPVSLEQTVDTYPDQTHVYTLRAENPGGFVEKTISITVLTPTSTATPTATACPLAVIHDFGATRTTINRGESTTLYWDLSGATEAYLNGSGVAGVAQQTVTLQQTTVFVLVAHNACGDTQKSLTITVRFATPTNTHTPTPTRTPTRTPTSTSYPTSTPTRNVLTATPTNPPQQNTITPYPTVDQSSPLDQPSPTPVEDPTKTPTWTPTPVPTSTFTPLPEETPTMLVQTSPLDDPTLTPTPTETPSETPTAPVVAGVLTETPEPTLALTPTPTTAPTGGTIRAYLCPLSVLLLFAVGIIVVSIVLPRLREKRAPQPAYSAEFEGAAFVPDDSLLSETSSIAEGVYLVEEDIIDAEPEQPVFKVPQKSPPGRGLSIDEPAD